MKQPTLLLAAAALLTAASSVSAQNLLVNGDFETDPFPDGWTATANVLTIGGLAPGSTVAARLAATNERVGQEMFGAADWALDFYFAIRPDAGANRAFSVFINQTGGPDNLGAGAINLRYQNGQFNTFAAGSWGADLGIGTVNPSVDADDNGSFNDPSDTKNVYHMRITGANWGTPAASYSIQLSDANQTNFTRSVNGLTRYQNTSGVNGGPSAFVFNTAFGNNPGFYVDDVSYEEFFGADDPNLELVNSGDLFGTLPVDSPALTRVLVVTNTGETKNLYLTNAPISGPDAARYSVVDTAFPAVVPPGGTTNITVRFDPGTASGQFSATLKLNSNDRGTPAYAVNLAASRLAGGTQLLANPGFESTPFATGWIADTNISLPAGGLVPGSGTSAFLGVGTRLGQNILCSPDWSMEFAFALTEATAEGFSMYVTTIGDIFNAGEVKLRVIYSANQWSVAGQPQPDLGTVMLSVDADGNYDLSDPGDTKNVYRLRITGHRWTSAGADATVDVEVSNANEPGFARGVFGIPVDPRQAAPYGFAFDSLAPENPGFWIDEVRVCAVSAAPVEQPAITEYRAVGQSFQFRWQSQPNATYSIDMKTAIESAWQRKAGPIASEGALTGYTNDLSGGVGFYRVVKH